MARTAQERLEKERRDGRIAKMAADVWLRTVRVDPEGGDVGAANPFQCIRLASAFVDAVDGLEAEPLPPPAVPPPVTIGLRTTSPEGDS